FLPSLLAHSTAQFTVVGPDQPVTAVVGDDVVLPCHLCPRMSAENMEVRWFQRESIPFVHLYRYGKDKFGQQMSKYRGRTELSKAGITDGNVALRIVNVRPSDEGQYHCFVQDGASYEETVLELKVAASGSAPHISVEDYQDGGIRVVCRSAGWYPEPEVVWRDLNGQAFPSASQTNSQEANGLYGTQTSAIVMENSNRNLSCLVRNTRLSQEKESTLFYISDPLFPKVNPWKVSLDMMILVVLFGFIALSVYLFKIKGHAYVLMLLTEGLCPAWTLGHSGTLLFLLPRQRTQESMGGSLLCQGKGPESASCHGWDRDTPAPSAWLLGPDPANPLLVLSEDGKRVRWEQKRQPLPDTPERFDTCFCVLGREGYTSGKHCWEMGVGDGRYWAVGVATESVSRKGGMSLSPQGRIWAVRWWGDEFQALTDPATSLPLRHPSRIRVCLDCDWGQVTFMDAGSNAPIFTFPPGSFS
uniref:Butyrophilin subfamily 1 member A1 n=1 Tax=Pelodiscus sinensis TaxID=13735 RepID=K7FFJ1_PELSI